MPFKIIETVRRGKSQLCIVPSQWESKGILRWPKKIIELKLVRDENSIPKSHWSKINCTVKKKNLLTYNEANEQLQIMFNHMESDQEEETEVETEDLGDFHDYIEQLVIKQERRNSAARIASGSQSSDTSNAGAQAITLLESNSDTKIIAQNQMVMFSIMNKIVENQKIIMHKLASLSEQMEEIFSKTNETNLKEASESTENPSYYVKHITKVEELDEFEKLLYDSDYKNKTLNSCLIVCNGGVGEGINCAYRFLDVLFSRQFLCKCSWSGGTRDNSVKVCLKRYQNTLTFFFDLVKQWDPSYTIEANETFFKNILRNAKKRTTVMHQRTPKQRHRSKGVKRVKKQTDTNTVNEIEESINVEIEPINEECPK